MQTISVVDSHTAGEPTRLVVSGGPDLGTGTITQRARRLQEQHARFRAAVVGEPRGSEALVAGLLCDPSDNRHATGVIFFDNAGVLGMCGHGTIGTLITLRDQFGIDIGSHTIETPVGVVSTELLSDNRARFKNVACFRLHKDVTIDVPSCGPVTGDVAWGGNWFFVVKFWDGPINADRIENLLTITRAIRTTLNSNGITGTNGAPLDHVQLLSEPERELGDLRNFVLCPGGSYDRSPCGTGTSAALACFAADGLLLPGKHLRMESVIGSVFEASYQRDGDAIIPTIGGEAYVTGKSELMLNPRDPYCYGISPR